MKPWIKPQRYLNSPPTPRALTSNPEATGSLGSATILGFLGAKTPRMYLDSYCTWLICHNWVSNCQCMKLQLTAQMEMYQIGSCANMQVYGSWYGMDWFRVNSVRKLIMVSRSAPCNSHRVTSNSYIQQFENDFRVSITTLGFQQPVPTISRKNTNSHYPGSLGPQKNVLMKIRRKWVKKVRPCKILMM